MDLTQAYLREILDYDAATGHFTWRKKISAKVVVGKRAGSVNSDGYVSIGILGKSHYGHHLAWLYMTGEWPPRLDHIDCDEGNNAWLNLRIATKSQNAANAPLSAKSKSGFKGVSWHSAGGKWQVHCGHRGGYLGLFDTAEAAHAAYVKEATKRYGEFARAK